MYHPELSDVSPSPDSPQTTEGRISEVRDRVDAIFAWKLSEGPYRFLEPNVPSVVPFDFVPDNSHNATEIHFTFNDGIDDINVVITKGLTESGANSGIKEEPEDITIDISNLPTVFRLRSNGIAKAESRFARVRNAVLDEFVTTRFDIESGAKVAPKLQPLTERGITKSDLFYIDSVLDMVGFPGGDGAEAEVIETHRNRTVSLWVRD